MPQKTKRQKIRAARRPVNVPAAPVQPVERMPSRITRLNESSDQAVPQMAPRASVAPLNYDYSYVYRDLRRIAILAVSFFVILIALSFFLPQIYR